MGRYPFMERADEYMATRRGCLAETSWDVQYRRFKRMDRDMIMLKEQGRVSTLSPAKMTEDDVKEFILYRKGKKNCHSDLSHDITALEQLLVFCGNVAVGKCLQKNPGLRPPQRQVRLDPLSPETYAKIVKAYNGCNHLDFFEVRAYALVMMSVALGTRNKELRLSDVSDLDMGSWTFTIRHVKGEDTYGTKRSVPIPEEVRSVILNYLSVREQWLISSGYSTKALFFGTQGEHTHLSGNSFRKIKSKVEDAIGEKFELRDCRRAFGQTYLNKGLETESVSVLMGHSTTKTTELYYCRVNESEAIRKAREVW